QWVGQLRGGEGVFAIGTADGNAGNGALVARQPRPNLQCFGKLCLSWYGLSKGDRNYRPLPVDFTLGPDLARSLHAVWAEIEAHADQLDRLFRQQAGLTFEVVDGKYGAALAVNVPLAEPHHALRVLLEGKHVHYYLLKDGELLMADSQEERIARGVYLLL